MPAVSSKNRSIPPATTPWLGLVFLVGLSLVLLPAKHGPSQSLDDPVDISPEGPDAEEAPRPFTVHRARPAKSAGGFGVIVLFDWRVVGGRIEEIADGYRLTRNDGGVETIPAAYVRTSADSLDGAYATLRDAMRNPRPDEHLELATWCVRQKLYDSAREQLAAALTLDPNRREARDLLKQVEEKLVPNPLHRGVEDAPARTQDGFLAGTARTTSGLSPATMATYVKKIQPLLLNKCGNVSCHGERANRDFALLPVRGGALSGRSSTFDNLDATLARLDPVSPEQSPLLSVLSTETHRGVFRGQAGNVQEAVLRDWLKLAAGELTPVEVAAPASQVTQAVAVRDPFARPRSPLQKASAPPVLQSTEQEKVLAGALKDERPDPFDPEAFNREMHANRTRP